MLLNASPINAVVLNGDTAASVIESTLPQSDTLLVLLDAGLDGGYSLYRDGGFNHVELAEPSGSCLFVYDARTKVVLVPGASPYQSDDVVTTGVDAQVRLGG